MVQNDSRATPLEGNIMMQSLVASMLLPLFVRQRNIVNYDVKQKINPTQNTAGAI